MNELVNNPLVWIGMLSVAAVVVGTIFGIGQWKGRLDATGPRSARTLIRIGARSEIS